MFVDSVKISVRAGDGGRGCRSVYRDKYCPRGVPDGGDGGKGADIIFRVDRNLNTLLDFQYHHQYIGRHGEHGSGKKKKGKGATAVLIRVPCGTIIRDARTHCLLRELDKDQEEVILAKGGKGGLGNRHKRIDATAGEKGEEKELLLDLRLIADAGLIGFPNVGKSTLISSITNAHPKIAAYPFTTKSPILGLVHSTACSFVIADIPGLIEGSSEGRGLGDRFLKHVERTKVLVHLIDMSGFEGRNPIEDYRIIKNELKNYNPEVARKPQVLVANKMDIEGASLNLVKFKQVVKQKIYPISALKKEGLEELVAAIRKKI